MDETPLAPEKADLLHSQYQVLLEISEAHARADRIPVSQMSILMISVKK